MVLVILVLECVLLLLWHAQPTQARHEWKFPLLQRLQTEKNAMYSAYLMIHSIKHNNKRIFAKKRYCTTHSMLNTDQIKTRN